MEKHTFNMNQRSKSAQSLYPQDLREIAFAVARKQASGPFTASAGTKKENVLPKGPHKLTVPSKRELEETNTECFHSFILSSNIYSVSTMFQYWAMP